MKARELIIDSFAGGGGASTGIELALGRPVDIAINHDEAAIAMHKVNHPLTKHYLEDVWEVDPLEACAGRPVGLAWFSPDCKHFSKAKGGKPVEKSIRGLAWVAVKWAKAVRPRVIILENVEEFKTWGPLTEDNYPDPKRKGETFNLFIRALKKLGYKVDFRELKACDYGAPTIRKRFFMVARCDGKKIVWPEPTHGEPDTLAVRAGILEPWRTAAECIDWSIPCPSIFERKKPLAENTLKRIAKGIQKFVIDNPRPFIINYKYENEPESVNKPLSTITTVNGHYLVAPFLTQYHSYDDTARGQTVDKPVLTVDTSNRYGLVTAFISKFYGGFYDGAGSSVEEPLHTATSKDHNALVVSHIIQMNNHSTGHRVTDPLNTIVAGPGHLGEVRTFLMTYYGNGEDVGQRVDEPLRTITTRDRFGIVTVLGQDYQIVDIGMRMLEPRELFNAQGFPRDYMIERDENGKPFSKKDQVAKCGNAVCPDLAKALVSANLPELCVDGCEDEGMDDREGVAL